MSDERDIIRAEVVDLAPLATESALAPLEQLPPADRAPALVYLGRLTSEHSRRAMRGQMNRIARLMSGGQIVTDENGKPELHGGDCDALTLDWGAVRYQHAALIRTLLAEHYSPATVNQALAALRGVLKDAWRLGLMSAEDYARAADVQGIKGERLPAGRHVADEELLRLFMNCAQEGTLLARRDAALLAVMAGTGPRRAEVAGADLADYQREAGELIIRQGKGRKERLLPLEGSAKAALDSWLDARGDTDGPLFCEVRGGKATLRRLTDQAVYMALKTRAEKAGVKDFSPHDLRRTFIGNLLTSGADISTAQRLAGHSQVTTTARYDRRGEAVKREAVKRLKVPYVSFAL